MTKRNQEFPKNPTEIMDYAEEIISRRFSKRVVKFPQVSSWAQNYPAAGSAKAESEYGAIFNKIIFANPKRLSERNESYAISFGKGDFGQFLFPLVCSAMIAVAVPNEFSRELINFYRKHRNEEDDGYDSNKRKLWWTMHQFIDNSYRRFNDVFMLAFDQDSKRLGEFETKGFYHKGLMLTRGGYGVSNLYELQKMEGNEFVLQGRREERISLANRIADSVLMGHLPSLRNEDLMKFLSKLR